MRVVITGGQGFIGRALARSLLARGEVAGRTIDDIIAVDRPDHVSDHEPGIISVTGDVCDRAQMAALLECEEVVVLHLASVVSGDCERDFDLALRVNIDGGRSVLEACRNHGGRPRLVVASTIAVFGGSAMPAIVGDATKQTPETTYGVTKAICELLVNEYTRKEFVDGRCVRLPTVIIRPGPPNAAASSFASAVFREPLAGRDYALPVALATRLPVIGERTAIEGILRLADADGADLGDDRAVNLPSLSVTVREMLESLQRVAGTRELGAVELASDPRVDAIVSTWAQRTSYQRALALGMPRDSSLDAIVHAYIEDYAV